MTAIKLTRIIQDKSVSSSNTLMMLPIPKIGAKMSVVKMNPKTP